jgi:UDP-2,3-diacylglucosamine pyrophosphatase LpxH
MSDIAPRSAIRAHLPDDALLVFISDTHIGGEDGTDIFESAEELVALLEDLGREQGRVDLVIAGDFLDFQRMSDPVEGDDRLGSTIARPEYQQLFAAFRAFAEGPAHRTVYLAGNHDAEVWWNTEIQVSLVEAGIVHEFGLSYAAQFESAPHDLIYCEHGNQFDPANRITDHRDPLDTPLGTHVVTELVRPIGSGAAVTESLDLRDVNYVFPIGEIPDWIGGRIFYQFLSQAIRWLLTPLILLGVIVALVSQRNDQSGVRGLLTGVAYDLVLLMVAFGVLFLLSRRMVRQAISILSTTSFGQAVAAKRYHSDDEIRSLIESGSPPPMAPDVSTDEVAVWVSGHTHGPSLSEFARDGGRTTAIANTGCWLRQLQPVQARLGAPTVYVPAFVHTHVRVRLDEGGFNVELWDHPRRLRPHLRWIDPLRIIPKSPKHLEQPQLQWVERVAILGRMPSQPPTGPARVISSSEVPRRTVPEST